MSRTIPTTKPAPVAKRVYLTGLKITGFEVLVKDNRAEHVIWRMPVPTMKAGHAVVRALRAQDAAGGIF